MSTNRAVGGRGERERERDGKWACVCGFTFPHFPLSGGVGWGGDGADRTNTHHTSSVVPKIKAGSKEKMAAFFEPCLETKKGFFCSRLRCFPVYRIFNFFFQFTLLRILALSRNLQKRKEKKTALPDHTWLTKNGLSLKALLGGFGMVWNRANNKILWKSKRSKISAISYGKIIKDNENKTVQKSPTVTVVGRVVTVRTVLSLPFDPCLETRKFGKKNSSSKWCYFPASRFSRSSPVQFSK